MWVDFIGAFLSVVGFVIGLGAVTVIDIHGFLGRTSKYWTEATTRTHKVTKPMIWIGMVFAIVGGMLLYWRDGWAAIHMAQALIAFALVVNGCFLTFWVSPYLLQRERQGRADRLLPMFWQRRITVSFLISVIGWWTEVVLFCLAVTGMTEVLLG